MIAALPTQLEIGGARISLHATDRPAALDDLAPDERRRALALAGRRRHDYLLGRAALQQALAALGPDRDTSAIAMPHPRFSLTHGGGIAVAACSHADDARGIGVDWEAPRRVDRAAARFFLTEREAAAAGDDPDTLLRLWTVKEALFKSTPDNAGLTVRMFEVDDPAAAAGMARLACRPGLRLHYATCRRGGFLSAALAFHTSSRT